MRARLSHDGVRPGKGRDLRVFVQPGGGGAFGTFWFSIMALFLSFWGVQDPGAHKAGFRERFPKMTGRVKALNSQLKGSV